MEEPMPPKEIKIKCPKCRNGVIESAKEGEGQLVTRFKKVRKIRGQLFVQCRDCNNWISIPSGLI